MKTVTTLGIDMSSKPDATAVCTITWETDRAVVTEPQLGCDDRKLAEMIVTSDAVGIDAPFGWPTAFTESVGTWIFGDWSDELRKQLCFRETDRFVRKKVEHWPLSVSADRLALPAMRTCGLLARCGVADRSGDGKFYEVYPAGTLCQWGLISRGYKKNTDVHKQARQSILERLSQAMPWLVVPAACATTDHGLDALIASLTARAAMLGRTLQPPPEQADYARREGWIHLPKDLPTL
jgi:predicted nuclease with RNAse H fold